MWLSLPHLISNLSYLQLADFLSSPSYIIVQSPTQSPTQSLEWHVWLSSSGNNCHAVQRSLSSGASVYECIMGFYLVPFHQPNPPMRFLLITGHWNVSLPSGASPWNGMFGRVKSQYITRAIWDLIIVVKICIEPNTLLGLAENRIVYQCVTDSPEQGFEFRAFLSWPVTLLKLESPIYPTILSLAEDWIPSLYIYIYIYICNVDSWIYITLHFFSLLTKLSDVFLIASHIAFPFHSWPHPSRPCWPLQILL